MEAKELMIGDWVSYNGISNEISLADFGIDKGHTEWRNEIEPIPLTPEILEKNGFKYTNNHTLQGADTYLLRYEQNGFDYTITYKLNDWFAVDSYDDRMYRIFEMETGRWCVHELQHALRLCGIEKKIVL